MISFLGMAVPQARRRYASNSISIMNVPATHAHASRLLMMAHVAPMAQPGVLDIPRSAFSEYT
jgi:hypothetical protein